MSRRARVLTTVTDVQRCDWTQESRPAAAEAWTPGTVARPSAGPVAMPRPAVVAPTVTSPAGAAPGLAAPTTPAAPPATDESLLAEHGERLAGLEREAFTKGYAQGERAGLEAGGKRAEAMLRRIGQTIEELSGLRQTLITETEREMVQLALILARRVVHREVTLDPELAAALAHVALERLGTNTPATVRLNPEDYTIVAQDSARWGGQTVTVVPDPSISRGGCLVESAFGSVDATIERQFDELSQALFGGDR
ncbi:MAG: FliH/SctL family protein [Vicinamibacteraceae bacterium]